VRHEAPVGPEGAADRPVAAPPDDESTARRMALDALSRSARTRGQLEVMLERKGIAPEVAAVVLDRFENVGLVDDVGYAEAFVESRHQIRGQGGLALAFELRRRGVADEVAAQALAALDADRQFATACRLAQARLARLGGLSAEVRTRRVAGFLARKGYPGDVVARAVREATQLAELEADAL
jgi:regulatory protein